MIRRRSKKRAAQEREYKKVHDEYLSEHEQCEVCGWGANLQIHHKKGRINTLLTDKRYFLAVCHTCHQKIELFPQWAKEKGYSLSRTATEPHIL